MAERQTEMRHSAAQGLELRPAEEILEVLASAQVDAAKCVAIAIPEIAHGATVAAQSIRAGGRLIYVAAGSSGLMALADALELPGTYGISPGQIVVRLAGGFASLVAMKGGPEDDAAMGRQEIEALALNSDDCVIALTASGETPYPVSAIETARATGARTVGLSNNPGTRILELAEVGICLPTPPEVIAGSTRMGAGTAQKIALNMLSTLMAVELGHVHDGFMVNVIADNLKLKQRANGIVAAITGTNAEGADAALAASNGAVKLAVLIAAGADDLAMAASVLDQHRGHLRPALAALRI